MAIRVRLAAMLVRRRMSLGELSDRIGVPEADLQILRVGEARALRFSTLDALCRELACGPGELLAHEAEEDDA